MSLHSFFQSNTRSVSPSLFEFRQSAGAVAGNMIRRLRRDPCTRGACHDIETLPPKPRAEKDHYAPEPGTQDPGQDE
jgi:hypothetical protein